MQCTYTDAVWTERVAMTVLRQVRDCNTVPSTLRCSVGSAARCCRHRNWSVACACTCTVEILRSNVPGIWAIILSALIGSAGEGSTPSSFVVASLWVSVFLMVAFTLYGMWRKHACTHTPQFHVIPSWHAECITNPPSCALVSVSCLFCALISVSVSSALVSLTRDVVERWTENRGCLFLRRNPMVPGEAILKSAEGAYKELPRRLLLSRKDRVQRDARYTHCHAGVYS